MSKIVENWWIPLIIVAVKLICILAISVTVFASDMEENTPDNEGHVINAEEYITDEENHMFDAKEDTVEMEGGVFGLEVNTTDMEAYALDMEGCSPDVEAKGISETRKLDMNLQCSDHDIETNDDNIYYSNKEITVRFPDSVFEQEDIVESEIEAIKSEYGEDELIVQVDEFAGKSVWDGNSFSSFEELDEKEVCLSPKEGDKYERNAVRFEYIKSYKLYSGENLIKIIDITYMSEPYQFIFDMTAPVIERIGAADYSDPVSSGNSAVVRIKDAAGISKIELYRNSNLADVVNITEEKRMIEYEYEINLIKENSDKDEVLIKVWDLSGNESTFSMSYMIDNKAPEIKITTEDGQAADGRIFSEAVTIKTIAADNSGKCSIFYKCFYSDGTGNTTCIENGTKEFDKEAKVFNRYYEEGVYDIVAFAYDDSGNYSETCRASFGIDKYSPIVTLENVVNGKIYNGPVSVYATLRDLFFDGVSAEVVGTVADKSGERKLEISPFMIAAKVNRNVYTFYEDGCYRLKLKSKDTTGRESECECGFVIDRKPPEINVHAEKGLEDFIERANSQSGEKIVCGEKPKLIVETEDELSEYEILSALYRKDEDGSFREEGLEKIVSIGKKAAFPIDIKREGEYLLKISLKDTAGNSSEKSIAFIVDEEPPVIGYIDSFNEKYLKYFKLTDNMKNYISDATKVTYKTYLNAKEVGNVDLKKDGKYILQIVAEDEAGNMSEQMAAFIVDNTSPKVIVHGMEDGGKVSKDDVIKLTLFDEADYFKSVTVNGENLSMPDNKEINIKATKYGDYDIAVVAADYAGNEVTEVVKMQCAMAENPFNVKINESDIKTLTKNDEQIRESFFEKFGLKGLLISSGIIVTTVVIFGVFAFVDTKKNKG